MVVSKKNFDELIDYLDLVEEYNEESPINLFEKVRIMSNRARDLYAGKTSKLVSTAEGGKPVALAQYELLKGLIEPDISKNDDKDSKYQDDIKYE